MTISNILKEIKDTPGSNGKKDLLIQHSNNECLKKVLKYSLDPFTPFNIVKVPRVNTRLEFPLSDDASWQEFFKVADMCADRILTGNEAIDAMHACFSSVTPENEKWMRKILKKHLSIGASTKTVNKVFPGLVPTFEVSLAQKFDEKRAEGKRICIEPKLDGIRCLAIVRKSVPLLYARSGKLITNFDETIGAELSNLPDGVYDGEIMGEDFTALMRQAYRKESIDVTGTYFAIFDYIHLSEWDTKESFISCEERYTRLLHHVMPERHRYLKVVDRIYCMLGEVQDLHNKFVSQGYEGSMIKDLSAPYKFGRGYEVMKLKSFHDVDLEIESILEGTGKHKGKAGSVVVNFQGVEVQVGSGLTDDLREKMWASPEDFLGRVIEVRYQEITPDGSLRFPTFVCFRNDR